MISEVCALRGCQEGLAVRAPEDPRRLFGEAVEAAAAPSAECLSTVCTNIVDRTIPLVIEKLTSYIDDRLAHLDGRQRVNLNVRAPKRPVSQQPPIARDIAGAGRPYPVARFLDEKQRADPTWPCVRTRFAPAFGMQVLILKKRKLKNEGRAAVYVEQNHRAQMLYTEEDRGLMEEAWELTVAHREDLVGRCAQPAVQGRPSVLDMLRATEVD